MKRFAFLLLLFVSGWSGADAALPRVLIIGDDIYREPAQSAARELGGKAELVHANAPGDGVLHTGISAAGVGRPCWETGNGT